MEKPNDMLLRDLAWSLAAHRLDLDRVKLPALELAGGLHFGSGFHNPAMSATLGVTSLILVVRHRAKAVLSPLEELE